MSTMSAVAKPSKKLNENGFLHDQKHEHYHEFTINDGDSIASGTDNDSDEVLNSQTVDEVADNSTASPGRLPDEVYEKTLAWWRASIRRFLVNNLSQESRWLAWMQRRVRTPWLDTYFLYSSSLGTHTFFMTTLPIFFFFGYPDAGRGLVFVLALGVYVSSFIKDLVCAPRPFAPPVTRLTIGSHHLEYGFPSTHSTNSVSVALFAFSRLSSLSLSPTLHTISLLILCIYVCTIVFGRLYTGMHSFTDCLVGTLLGTFVWFMYEQFWSVIEGWVVYSVWQGPLAVIVATALMVNQHPQPVDDCPCFEDAIAFVSVVAGILLARWGAVQAGFDDSQLASHMRGVPWLSQGFQANLWTDVWVWHTIAFLKLFTGILAIFAWRLFAKTTLLAILPPTFRALAHLFTLPHRRFYTPATDYSRVKLTEERRVLLHPIPSVMDLPGELRGAGLEENDARSATSGREIGVGTFGGGRELKSRSGKMGNGRTEKNGHNGSKTLSMQQGYPNIDEENEPMTEPEVVKHYDADVITKVIVYAGIGIIASAVSPITFEVLGWGVHP